MSYSHTRSVTQRVRPTCSRTSRRAKEVDNWKLQFGTRKSVEQVRSGVQAVEYEIAVFKRRFAPDPLGTTKTPPSKSAMLPIAPVWVYLHRLVEALHNLHAEVGSTELSCRIHGLKGLSEHALGQRSVPVESCPSTCRGGVRGKSRRAYSAVISHLNA